MTSLLENVHVGIQPPSPAYGVIVLRGDYQYWHYCCDGQDDRGWGCGYRTLQTLCSWVRYQQHRMFSLSYREPSASRALATSLAISNLDRDLCEQNGIRVVADGFQGCEVVAGPGGLKFSFPSHKDFELSAAHADCEAVATIVENDNSGDIEACVRSIACTETSAHLPSSSPLECGVPSLLQIQQALVVMGDKPSSFIGSHQWIGSYEVCLCLDYFFSVPCKIIHIRLGSELGQHLSTIHQHFSTFSSPVMMGGDSDASSKGIVGVCLNPPSLLVVDPHYVGKAGNVSCLQASGWVRWLPVAEFHQTSFYNLCLPQLAAQ